MTTDANLVKRNENGQVVTTSLLVAQKFNKEHKVVLASIRNLLYSAQNCAQFYVSTTYIDESGKSNPMYIMNRDGFTLLAMGFTGKEALKFKLDFIDAFNAMEQKLKEQANKIPQSFSEALMLAARQAEQIELQNSTIKEQAPKVEYFNEVLQSKSVYNTNQIAKELGMSAVSLYLPIPLPVQTVVISFLFVS